jgi:hypothetical protein
MGLTCITHVLKLSMTNPSFPSVRDPATDKFLGLMKFIRISRAAELLGCAADQLLHLGAIGEVEIVAPVVVAGEFAWPTEQGASAFIDLDRPFVRYFDASSRVGVFPNDLARIEAIGWATPWRFYAPDSAREVIKHSPRTFEESLLAINEQKRNKILEAKANAVEKLSKGGLSEEEEDRVKYFVNNPTFEDAKLLDRGAWQFREEGFRSAWVRVEAVDETTEKTTIEHLFIAAKEYARLQEGLPQTLTFPEAELAELPPKPERLNVAYNAKTRFDVFFAAVWLHRKAIKNVVKDATKWNRELQTQTQALWGTHASPLSERVIEDLLRDVLSDQGLENRKIGGKNFRSKEG